MKAAVAKHLAAIVVAFNIVSHVSGFQTGVTRRTSATPKIILSSRKSTPQINLLPRNTIDNSRSSTQLEMASAYEQLMERLPSKSVIDAVDKIPGDKVIASDVATRAGVPLSQARKDLTALASLSRGDISVSDDGELMYEFPPNLPAVLASNSAKFKTLQTVSWTMIHTLVVV